jgi:hypothetical protein
MTSTKNKLGLEGYTRDPNNGTKTKKILPVHVDQIQTSG